MPVTRTKSLDALYADVADHDLVVVPDQPLASALNRRLDRPHLGPFAITPRRLAARRRETAEDRTAFLEVVGETDLEWKRAAYAVGNVLQCWEHEGRLDAILEYDGYGDGTAETVVSTVDWTETTSGRLAEYRIESGTDVAVVGEPQLTALERSILPATYDAVSPFEAGSSFEHPPFRIFESKSAIVDALLGSVSVDDAGDVGVVLDGDSGYSPLVESALESAGIPFYGGPGFTDDPDRRAFCRLLRVAHRGTDVRVGEVKPVLRSLGADPGVEHDEKRLHALDDDSVRWIREFCDGVESRTFGEAVAAFERRNGASLPRFREELEALGLAETPITESAVDRLAFYLDAYEVPIDRENEGVLLADAKSAAYVDRPVVFFLGLDEGWTHSAPRRPWVDRDAQYDRNVRQFQMLLQSGVEQHYLVCDTEGGTPVTPCLYFEELLEAEFERFSDLDSVNHAPTAGGWTRGDGFETEPVEGAQSTPVEAVSQSSLKRYVNCPRDHFFDRLVDGPDRDFFEEGTLFHDFAEFYVNHPDAVDEAFLEDAVEFMLERTRPLVRRVDRETRRTRYRVGLETIRALLEENPPTDGAFLTSTSGWGSNAFAERYGRPVESPTTERWFENDDPGVNGKIDLVHGPTRLLDYKSGRKKRPSEVVRNSALESPSDTPEFQALLYLSHWRTQRPDERLEFTFFHFLETLEDAVVGGGGTEDGAGSGGGTADAGGGDDTANGLASDLDLEETLTTVTYHPTSFEAHARSRETFEYLREEGAGNCRKTLEAVGYDDYRAVFEAEDVPETRDSDELIQSAFGRTLLEEMRECVGEYNYVESGCKQLLRELIRVRNRNYFREDLDAFETFVEERLEEMNRRRRGEERYPIEGLGGEPNYRRVDNRDLLVGGSR